MAKAYTRYLFYGPVITPATIRSVSYIRDALLFVEAGKVRWIEKGVTDKNLDEILKRRGVSDQIMITRLKHGEFLMPGFIDTHTHAPQFPNLGRGGQYQLLDWLTNLTFPTESKFHDQKHAMRTYKSVVRRLIDSGTTTCCYYSSAHVIGSQILADIVHQSGQRGFIGLCNMDRNIPEFYLKGITHQDSLAHTREIISYVLSINSPLVKPILTPRFAITCTGDLLKGLGDLSTTYPDSTSRLPIQTHISENKTEVAFTASLFPSHDSYAHVYEDHGLLGSSTILAHGCHLTKDELELIKACGAGISHCPTSNFHLNSGIAPVGAWLDAGLKVGLGTDVSGGYSPSMLTAIQHASIASKVVAMQKPTHYINEMDRDSANGDAKDNKALRFSNVPLPLSALLYMATLAGAELCGLQEETGSLEEGKSFDALLVDLTSQTGNPKLWWEEEEYKDPTTARAELSEGDLQDFLEKFFFCGDDRNIAEVYVDGRLVGGRRWYLE